MGRFTGVFFALGHSGSLFTCFSVAEAKESLWILRGEDGFDELLELLISVLHQWNGSLLPTLPQVILILRKFGSRGVFFL